jgi:hypothetical protein
MREGAATPSGEPPARGRTARRRPVLAAALLATALVLVLLGRFSFTPGLDGLFGEETRDRSGPALLKSVVDLEKDARLLPDAIRGTRTLYVASGTVGAYVDLGKIGEGSITVDEKRTSATLRLPHARLAAPALDPEKSYAVSKQRGLLDRLGDLFSDNPADERAVHALAAQRIGEAARESDLGPRAEKNTTAMLEGMLRALGFEQVTVHYV